MIDLTLACVPKYGLDNELKQVIPSRPAGLGGRSISGRRAAESDGWCRGAIGIVGIASYGTKGWVEFGLVADKFVR